ncbi:MAG: hypothetical protein MUC48_26640 [Leptolyngbya sp. Prado105]|jgi:hypothetical protein|nr:hypothetical protein [Leptolyngbya sp. Prado105]
MNDRSTNIWQYKPWWCQPWSILLTGLSIISASWILFAKIWITGLAALLILVWMGFFLIIYPKQMQAYFNEVNRSETSD